MHDQIEKLSDEILVENLLRLTKEENELTGKVLLHLIELDKRRLYRDLGYTSLFSYCVSGLDYSETAAKRRITAARCISSFPEVYQMFLKREVSLTTISIFAPVLTDKNKDSVLLQVAGKPRADVEWITGRFHPRGPGWDRIIPIVIQKRVELTRNEAETENLENHLGPLRTQVEFSEKKVTQVVIEEQYRFEFSGTKAFKEKLEKVKSLASGRLFPGASLEATFELLMDASLPEARTLTFSSFSLNALLPENSNR